MLKQLTQFLFGGLTDRLKASSGGYDESSYSECTSVRRSSSLKNHYNWSGSRATRPRSGLLRLLLTGLLLGAVSQAHAGTFYCQADFGGVIDGFDPATFSYISSTNNTLGIDGSCTIRNWPEDNGIGGFPITNINYYFPGGADYYIVFDNVYYPGNMSCNDPNNSNFWIYWAPGSFNNISSKCQDFMVPVDMVVKTNPAAQTTASIDVPFTYTITAPKLGAWDVDTGVFSEIADSDTHADIENLVIFDDLSQTGADLTYITNKAYLVDTSTGTRTLLNGGAPLTLGASSAWLDAHSAVTITDPNQQLIFSYENNAALALVPSGYRVDIELTVKLNDVPANTPGLSFTNTSSMWFDKIVEYTQADGTTGYTPMTDLQAWPGTTEPMTIAEPDLVVTKSTSPTAMNLGTTADYRVSVQNIGGATAWETSVVDSFPDGMCDYFTANGAGGVSLGIYDATGATLLRSLSGGGADYDLAWTGDPTCELSLDMLTSNAAIAPTEQLIVSYPAQLDSDVVDGSTHTNIAVASQWYNSDSSSAGRKLYGPYTSTDGSEPYADTATMTATLSGYFFKKSVTNLTTGESPALSAAAGDVLHYTLSLENFNIPTLTGITINDDLGALNGVDYIVPGSLSNITYSLPAGATFSADPNGGTNGAGLITAGNFDLGTNEQYQIEFDVSVGANANGNAIQNQASIDGYDTGSAAALSGVSDDPFVNGPIALGSGGDITEVSVLTPGPLLKDNDSTTATIGKPFTYTITVPETPVNVPLYDVEIHDTLSDSSAVMHFVDAAVISGGTWTLSNVGTPTDLVIKDEVTGIDIPAGGQVAIQITVMLDNDSTNVAGLPFSNTANYSYSRINGSTDPQITTTNSTTADMSVVEPDLAVSKSVSFVTPASKVVGTDPATVGDVLEYTIAIPNNGQSTAYDTSVVDILPADVSYITASATAVLDDGTGTTPVSGFVSDPDPTSLASGTLVLGGQNGDGSLDIPAGQSLIVTYQVTVEAVTGTDITNTVYVDWLSWDGDSIEVRNGDGCPTVTAPDTYCAGPAQTTIATQDNTALSKQVFDDSYAETPVSTGNPVVRVGDTVTYDVVLELQEYTTQNVVVTDSLPQGMEFVSYSIDPGPTTFNYSMASAPVAGDTGTLTWDFGDIENVPSGDNTPVDPLLIRYVARVVTNSAPTGVDTSPTNSLTNSAALTYTGYDPANTSLTDSTTIDVLQPQLSTITKEDLNRASRAGSGTSADPYQVNIATDVMNFELQSCNNGLAPAYGVTLSDVLDPELDGSTLSAPVVSVGSTTLTAGSGYSYTYDSVTQTMSFVLNTEVNPAECVTVDYNVGFDTTLATQSTWNNHAALTQYASLPASGRLYTPTSFAEVYMTNLVSMVPLSKSVVSPASEATIGDEVTYQLVVPGSPANVALNNVEVTDSLHGALEYVSATAVDSGGSPVSLSDATSGQDVSLGITQIPAGEQVTITLTTRVANNSSANAGDTITNTAAYTYTGMSDPTQTQDNSGALTIVEPSVSVTKSVPAASPSAGDVLTYTVNVTAAGTGPGDVYSNAYDLIVEDTLGAGLEYVAGSTTLDGSPFNDPSISGQTLTWGPANGDDIDITEGNSITVTYQVLVLDTVVPGQSLTNSVIGRWTGQNGDLGTIERTGSNSPAVNDYFTVPATTELWIGDNTAITKSVFDDSYAEIPASTTNPVIRVGDTVTYDLTLNLQEGTTENVVVEDLLPTGMAFESYSIIQGSSGDFNYTTPLATEPSNGDSGTLTWAFGTIGNSANGSSVDQLVIRYVARVVTAAAPTGVDTATSNLLSNNASLSYTGGDPLVYPGRLTDSTTIEVRQPQMSAITKVDLDGATRTGSGTSGDPYQVNISSDEMRFQLESCNGGLAPAYGVVLSDDLAWELDETDLTTDPPVVSVGGTALSSSDYTLSVPPRDGVMQVTLQDSAPVGPGECVTVDYTLGFHNDITTQRTWNNLATLTGYNSLPAAAGRSYSTAGVAEVYMTNLVSIVPLSKSVVSPASEATIGDEVTYQLVVPGSPANVALDSVEVTDTLHGALEYVSASAVDSSGTFVSLTDNTSGQDVSLGITQIPAGEQVTITLTTRVANNSSANGGDTITNTAAYTYTGMADPTQTQNSSGALTIVEPELVIGKTVSNTTNPGQAPVAGDILQYSVTFDASGGAAGDNFSDAFDLLIEDSLSSGLSYITDSATVDGTGNTITNPTVVGDGSTSASQTLTWSLSDATADIDVPEGGAVTVTYNVEVLSGVQPGQALSNSASVQWTGIDGANAYERDGSNSPAVNDYFTGPATATITAQFAVTFSKSVVNTSTGQDPGDNASPGDTLQYTLTISNQSVDVLTNAAVVDELAAEIEPGTFNLISVSDGGADASNTNSTGGANGSGIVDVRGITLAPQGSAGDTVTIVFEATLAPVIPNGTSVLNSAQLTGNSLPATSSNLTSTLIGSAPQFEVWKSSQDLTGDPAVLVPGDTLRYTITVQNVGNEEAVNAELRDLIPANTTYVANSTRLNGSIVSDVSGTSPLQDGMTINAPGSAVGVMPADPSGTDYVATITFDVTVNDVFDGTVISNQGYVTAEGGGTTTPVPEEPTDDPSTTTQDDDPTLDVVGNVPSVDAQKLVEIIDVGGSAPGVVNTGDRLRYTITITNNGTTPATNVVFTDGVPIGTSYVANSTTLNTEPVADSGGSPLVAGIPVSSSDLTPPLPTAGNGTISPGETATITFVVDVTAASGVISNQGTVSLDQQVDEPTDFDGIDSNGDQPTTVTVNAAQQLGITKQAFIVGGGAALPGSTVEYLIRVTNTGVVPATDVVIADTVPAELHYVADSAVMNGSSSGIDDTTDPLLTADYAGTYGDLAPGEVVTLRFRAQLDSALTDATEILNTASVEWNAATQTASASARLVVGGYYGTATLNGQVWHDANYNNQFDSGEQPLANWNVDLYRNSAYVGTTLTDASGNYQLTNIQPNDTSGDVLELRFRAPGAGTNTAALGLADSNGQYTDGMQRISDITLAIGDNVLNQNLPIDPSGVVYNAVSRAPVAGATLTLLNGGVAVDPSCFDDTAQQGQVTLASGFYKFDLNFSQASCPQGADYVIRVIPPANGYRDRVSQYILPSSAVGTTAYDVPACSSTAASGYCEALPTESVPATGAATTYYLHLTLNDPQPTSSQLFNNHIPLDPVLNEAVAITKTSSRVNVSRSEMVPYTITVNNAYLSTLQDLTIVDTFPAGFKYVKGSSRFDGQPLEPATVGNQLRWEHINLATDVQHTIQMVFIVGSGVSEGEYVNRAQVISSQTADAVSGQASATVRVVPDPTFDCTDIIGKVFDDKNHNGTQDEGEQGLQNSRVVTARGLKVTSDKYGRFHITCAAVPDENRGSNFILKLDERSLPTGYRVTTENPRVQRLTRGKMAKFNFGATIHHVVRIDVADGVFEPDSINMRNQWRPRIGLLLEELKKSPSVLHISYLADVEDKGLVRKRVAVLKEMIADRWDDLECCYQLTIETEVYWRRGAPPKRSGVLD